MSTRFNLGRVQPAAYQALAALDNYIMQTSIPQPLQEIIRIRASQINGCAYCVHAHSSDARKAGVSESKIELLTAWKEAPNVFDPEEQLLLAMTEDITRIHERGLRDDLYQQALTTFGEVKTAQIIMTIIHINAWNRIGVGLKMQPEL